MVEEESAQAMKLVLENLKARLVSDVMSCSKCQIKSTLTVQLPAVSPEA